MIKFNGLSLKDAKIILNSEITSSLKDFLDSPSKYQF